MTAREFDKAAHEKSVAEESPKLEAWWREQDEAERQEVLADTELLAKFDRMSFREFDEWADSLSDSQQDTVFFEVIDERREHTFRVALREVGRLAEWDAAQAHCYDAFKRYLEDEIDVQLRRKALAARDYGFQLRIELVELLDRRRKPDLEAFMRGS